MATTLAGCSSMNDTDASSEVLLKEIEQMLLKVKTPTERTAILFKIQALSRLVTGWVPSWLPSADDDGFVSLIQPFVNWIREILEDE